MTKVIAILQSNYIPWKGYFDLINSVDEFVLYDDMQYTRRDWRNRNKIKTPSGTQWLTIPVQVKGKYSQRINETHISDSAWAGQHWKSILTNYQRASYFQHYHDLFEALYMSASQTLLSQINEHFLRAICEVLGIKTRISWSSEYEIIDGKTERLVSICQQSGATHYMSGPAAKSYIDAAQFQAAGISLSFMDYDGYPEYPQLFPPFDHAVSILDLIFNVGTDAPNYMKSFRERAESWEER